uniref:Uncharacterized protein n=2 Tax=Hemiselmis tepida TaxID=464990 RepID=A0A7S0YUC4_9CRYP|mmetsp:Transcript_21812/g.55098  ORF Transcript_21812/g.55098 Transcript_21812/m.55098 type:complete len:283 (+) Transcript_21812:396-1244(+)
MSAAPKRSTTSAGGAQGQGGKGAAGGGEGEGSTMAPQMSAVKVAAQPAAAEAQPDPATMSARDRIRMHVQKNLQKQQQQQALQQQQAKAGGGGVSSKKAHGALHSLQVPVTAPARKRAHGDTRSSGDGSPTWETNTPPSGLSAEEEASGKRRRRADDEGLGGSDTESAGDFCDTEDGMAGPSPQQGMMGAGIDHALNESLGELGGAPLFENPHDDGPHERVHRVSSPGGAAEEASGFDSPPCEVGCFGGEVTVGAAAEPTAGPGGVVDDEWVKGLYDMEGME